MKAEERAKMLVRLIQGRQESWDWHADNIASAIRSAENEALERAVAATRTGKTMTTRRFSGEYEEREILLSYDAIREAILALKHKDI